MLLTIDVGNTQTVLGIFSDEDVIEHWRIATDPDRTADEIAVVLQGLLGQSPILKEADISGIALCSTVPWSTNATAYSLSFAISGIWYSRLLRKANVPPTLRLFSYGPTPRKLNPRRLRKPPA